MTYSYTTAENQSFFDLALMLLGDASKAWELSTLNNISILNIIQPNTIILYESDFLPTITDGFNNSSNTVIATSATNILLVNSFDDSFNLNEFI